MRTRRIVSRVLIAVCSIVAFIMASLGVGASATTQAAPTQLVGQASSLTDFNTTLTGSASDHTHTVAINVSWDSMIKTHVNVEISVYRGVGSLSHLNGSSYTFTLPVRDFTLTGNSASLDTHGDLGHVGHVSAHWTYTTKPNTSNCFGLSGGQHVIATGSATFNLSFPCDGSFSGQISGNNVDSDSATSSSAGKSNSAYSGLPSLFFTAVTAQHSSKGIDLEVLAYQFSGLGNFVFVSLGAGTSGNISSTANSAAAGLTQAEFGLTQYSHFATDTLKPGALTTGTNPVASLNYSGSLGAANIVWHAKSGGNSAFTMTMQGSCLNKALTGAQANTSVVFSTQEVSLSGSASVKTCMADKATFGSGDSGGMIHTHKGTAPAPGAGAGSGTGSGPGSGTSISSGSFAVSSASPADGATGVSLSAAISVTFNAPPGKVAQIILAEANNPAGVVMLPPPTISGNTITSAPPTPLKPNTQYKETVVAQGAAGGFVSYTTTFTTGS